MENTRPLTEAEQAFMSQFPVLTPRMIRDAYATHSQPNPESE